MDILLGRIPETQEVSRLRQWIYAQRLKRCPYCLSVIYDACSMLLHLMEHSKSELREHRLQTLAEKKSDMLFRCRCQCKFHCFPTATQNEEANEWFEYLNKTHVAMKHHYGEDQMMMEENRTQPYRCLFRCSRFFPYQSYRDKHEKREHQWERRLFTDEYRLQSKRCIERCLRKEGHFGHPETDPDEFPFDPDVKQCRKQCLGYQMTNNRRNTL